MKNFVIATLLWIVLKGIVSGLSVLFILKGLIEMAFAVGILDSVLGLIAPIFGIMFFLERRKK